MKKRKQALSISLGQRLRFFYSPPPNSSPIPKNSPTGAPLRRSHRTQRPAPGSEVREGRWGREGERGEERGKTSLSLSHSLTFFFSSVPPLTHTNQSQFPARGDQRLARRRHRAAGEFSLFFVFFRGFRSRGRGRESDVERRKRKKRKKKLTRETKTTTKKTQKTGRHVDHPDARLRGRRGSGLHAARRGRPERPHRRRRRPRRRALRWKRRKRERERGGGGEPESRLPVVVVFFVPTYFQRGSARVLHAER